MANPLTGNISLKAVQSDLIMTTGNASLKDSKFKDFNNRTNTSNSLKAYDKKVWSQGRTAVETQYGYASANVRPYHWDIRYDGTSPYSAKKYVYYSSENGSPSWGQTFPSVRDMPCAAYNCGYAKVDVSRNRRYRIRCSKKQSANTIGYGSDNSYSELFVHSYTTGYLVGTQYTWLANSAIGSGREYTFDFDVGAAQNAPYLQILVRSYLSEWNGVMGYERYTNADYYNFELIEI